MIEDLFVIFVVNIKSITRWWSDTNIDLFIGKSFVRAHGLQSHLLSHSFETPFPCDICGKRFKNLIMLKNHQMRHNGIKKFVSTFYVLKLLVFK